jgi:hypothetical protein
MICRGPIDEGDLSDLVLPRVTEGEVAPSGDGSICVTA